MLDGLPYVQRYAWFALPASAGSGTTGLFNPGPVADRGRPRLRGGPLTALGPPGAVATARDVYYADMLGSGPDDGDV